MKIGIGLPTTLAFPGTQIADWARRAEERGFSSLATIDRIVYPNFDSLTTLAAAAAVTSRIGLLTNILLVPAYPPVWLAKATATIDAISGGRLTIGAGVGGRPDDFAALDRPFERRGKLMDESLDLLHRAWAGEPVTGDEHPVGPPPGGGNSGRVSGAGGNSGRVSGAGGNSGRVSGAGGNRVSMLIGGTGDKAYERMVKYGEGWTVGGVQPEQLPPLIAKVREIWQQAGREDEPRIVALGYYGLGDEAAAKAALRKYYGFLGDWTDAIVANASYTAAALKDVTRRFEEAGVGELILNPTVASLDEVDRLADAVL
jgi:alkanesulfonate monooxygenase SsuD/methylene tetrahydromethanopterin reductase-like flavin-dependent oxidoreductase (luciferase family)